MCACGGRTSEKADADTAPPVLVLRLRKPACVIYGVPGCPWAFFPAILDPWGVFYRGGPDDVPAPKTDMDKTCGERGTGGHMFG